MTKQVKEAYGDWFLKTFNIPVTHKHPMRFSDTDIEQAFEAGFKLGTFLQTGKNEVKQTR